MHSLKAAGVKGESHQSLAVWEAAFSTQKRGRCQEASGPVHSSTISTVQLWATKIQRAALCYAAFLLSANKKFSVGNKMTIEERNQCEYYHNGPVACTDFLMGRGEKKNK